MKEDVLIKFFGVVRKVELGKILNFETSWKGLECCSQTASDWQLLIWLVGGGKRNEEKKILFVSNVSEIRREWN